jgi:hypothetical protein
MTTRCGELLTCVYFSAEAQNGLAYSGANDGAVLLTVVDDFVFAVLNVVAWCIGPGSRYCGKGLEFISCN